jgi:hypothetical protein
MATRRGNREVRKPKQPKEKKVQAASTVSAIAARNLEQSGVSVSERAGPRRYGPAAPPKSPDRGPAKCRQPVHATSLQKNTVLIVTPTAMTPALTIHAGRALATGAPR